MSAPKDILGSNSIAAFGFTLPYQKFTILFPAIISLGTQIVCAKKLGMGKLNESNGIFSLALSFAAVVALLFIAAALIFPAQIADLSGADENLAIVHAEAVDYIRAYSLGLPAVAAVFILSPIMQLDSDRQRVFTAVTVLSATNIFGDLVSIFYLGAGMWGIGIATTVSYLSSAAFLAMHLG